MYRLQPRAKWGRVMANDFVPGQKVKVRHKDALSNETVWDGEIVKQGRDGQWWVKFGGYGCNFLMAESEISNG